MQPPIVEGQNQNKRNISARPGYGPGGGIPPKPKMMENKGISVAARFKQKQKQIDIRAEKEMNHTERQVPHLKFPPVA